MLELISAHLLDVIIWGVLVIYLVIMVIAHHRKDKD